MVVTVLFAFLGRRGRNKRKSVKSLGGNEKVKIVVLRRNCSEMYCESLGAIGGRKMRGSGCIGGIAVGNFEMCTR